MASSTYFKHEGSSSGRRLYVQVWYSVYYMPRLSSLVAPTRLHLIQHYHVEYFVFGNGAFFNKIFDVIIQHDSH